MHRQRQRGRHQIFHMAVAFRIFFCIQMGSWSFMDNQQLFHSITILATLGIIINVLAHLTYEEDKVA